MKRKIELEELIVKENNQKRLDSYVTDKLSKVSRTTAQRLIEEEKILVNGKKQKASYKPEEGDVISIEIPEAKDVELKAQDIPVPVVYEDNDIIVVNKPKGMVVHPANGNPDGTLVNAILAMCKDSLSGIGGEILLLRKSHSFLLFENTLAASCNLILYSIFLQLCLHMRCIEPKKF